MCGLAGIYGFKQSTEAYADYLGKCTASMRHRGPDDKGFWQKDNYAAAFVRLSIRDLSLNGHQPMLSACGNYVLTFNGEIYNSDNYIQTLTGKGVVFKSHADTEVLLYALIHLGIERVLDEFDGMFAFAFYDINANKLIIARDRIGIKPLYIGYSDDYLIYSSQYDHIINVPFIKSNTLNYTAIGTYLQYGYMPGGDAVVNKTFVVPQGHYVEADVNGFSIKKYYDFYNKGSVYKGPDAEQLFETSVKQQLISDVPVGSFLSGGVDSPLIAYWANKSAPIQTFTIGNEDPAYDESFYAKEYAKKLGVTQHFKTITEGDFLGLLDNNFKAFTEPFADFSSIPTMLVASMAKDKVSVILSGDGPDELFWGYDRNVSFPAKAGLFHKSKLSLLVQKLAGQHISKRYFQVKDLSSFYLKSLQTYGAEYWLPKVYKADIAINNFYNTIPAKYINPTETETAMQMARWLEMNVHLQRILLKVDRATMYYSLEARVPYLSNSVLDYAAQLSPQQCIAGKQGKYNMKQMLLNIFPEEWVMKKKQGFMIPMVKWINNDIKKDIFDTILNMPQELAAAFNRPQLENMLNRHVEGKKYSDSNGFIWAVYALAKWQSLHRNADVLK